MSTRCWIIVMAEAQAAFVGQNHVNLACFETSGQLYALDVSQVREIVRTQTITPLPMSPSLIEGVIDLRGAVIPVIDLARVIGRERAEETEQSRIVVLEFDGLVFGLCVEAATDVLSLDASNLEDVPALASHAGYDAVRHVVRRPEDTPVMVLSLEHLLENVYRSALHAQGQKIEEVG
jgi:purine-binding chemotaxis protein CheW